jgi:hypothetical protein
LTADTSPQPPAGAGRVLVGGWFSFAGALTTAGDLLAKDVVCAWLDRAARTYDVAMDPTFGRGVDWFKVDPAAYTDVVFVCGPFYRSDLLRRFEGCRLIGVNLSMQVPVEDWNPFDLLLERDSSQVHRPDVTFAASPARVPVVGLTLLPPEHAKDGHGDRYRQASDAIERLIARRGVASVPIDTSLEPPGPGTPTAPAVTSLMARMDIVVTTRLHGLVLALRGGVPALALEPIPGGYKVRPQAEILGWPAVVGIEDLSDRTLDEAFDLCLSDEGRRLALACAERAAAEVAEVAERFIDAMVEPATAGDGRRRRIWLRG